MPEDSPDPAIVETQLSLGIMLMAVLLTPVVYLWKGPPGTLFFFGSIGAVAHILQAFIFVHSREPAFCARGRAARLLYLLFWTLLTAVLCYLFKLWALPLSLAAYTGHVWLTVRGKGHSLPSLLAESGHLLLKAFRGPP